ncbi:TPA: hypothetical protein QDB45_001722 [Burkholderia vietnamiensis]|nr:hypothetical protein [Burkholderia vietnamiensis]
MAEDQRTPRRWEGNGKKDTEGNFVIPERYWDQGYDKWRERYRTTNVPMTTLNPRKEVQDGFPVGPEGERLEGFFDAGYHVEQLRQKYADSGMNERGIRSVVAADLQSLYNDRREALDPAMGNISRAGHATGPDHYRLSLLRDAEKASVEEHLARLRDQPNADQLIESAKDRFADLQAYDFEQNHPIANPDRDLSKVPPTEQERFNWLFGRDNDEHGTRRSPAPADIYEHSEYDTLQYTSMSSKEGVATRQISPLPRPANDVDFSVREAIREDAAKAVQDQKEAADYAASLTKDLPPKPPEPREFKPEPFTPEPNHRPRATEDGERYYRGTLAETGEAPVRAGDPSAEIVPFARLEGPNGENWKVFDRNVPRVIQQAGFKEGDTLELRKQSHDQGGRWVAKPHDFEAHLAEQKQAYEQSLDAKREQHEYDEAKRFEKFEADAIAWKSRNPQAIAEERVSNWLDAASAQPAGEPVEQRERRARPALDRILGRAASDASAKQDVKDVSPAAQQPGPAATLGDEVERLRAERDQRLGLNTAGRPAAPDAVAPEAPAKQEVKQDVKDASPAAQQPGTAETLGDEVERLRAERDQRLGLNTGERAAAPAPSLERLGERLDARASVTPEVEQQDDGKQRQSQGAAAAGGPSVNAEPQRDAAEHAPEVSDTPARAPLRNLSGLAEKVDARNAENAARDSVAQPVEHAASEKIDQPAVAAEQPKVDAPADVKPEVAPEVSNAAVQPPLRNLSGLAEKLDERQSQAAAQPVEQTSSEKIDQPAVAAEQQKVDATTDVKPDATAPAVESAAPAHAEAVQPEVSNAPAQPPLRNLSGLAEKLDARLAEHVANEKIDQPAVAAEQQKADVQPVAAEPSKPEVAQPVQPVAEQPTVEVKPETAAPEQAPAVAQAQPVQPPVAAEQPKPEVAAPAQAVEQPVQQVAPTPAAQPVEPPKVEQQAPVQAQAQPEPVQQPVAQPVAEQAPVNRQMPESLNATSLATRLNADVKAFNAEHTPALDRASSSIERMLANAKVLEQQLAQHQSQDAAPLDLVASQEQSQSDGMRMRLRHKL